MIKPPPTLTVISLQPNRIMPLPCLKPVRGPSRLWTAPWARSLGGNCSSGWHPTPSAAVPPSQGSTHWLHGTPCRFYSPPGSISSASNILPPSHYQDTNSPSIPPSQSTQPGDPDGKAGLKDVYCLASKCIFIMNISLNFENKNILPKNSDFWLLLKNKEARPH